MRKPQAIVRRGAAHGPGKQGVKADSGMQAVEELHTASAGATVTHRTYTSTSRCEGRERGAEIGRRQR